MNRHYCTHCGVGSAIGKEFEEKIADKKNAFIRSVVPPGLVTEILNQIDGYIKG